MDSVMDSFIKIPRSFGAPHLAGVPVDVFGRVRSEATGPEQFGTSCTATMGGAMIFEWWIFWWIFKP